jgi:hypothetical protein
MNSLVICIIGIGMGWWVANKVRDGKNPIQEVQNIIESVIKTISKLFNGKGKGNNSDG